MTSVAAAAHRVEKVPGGIRQDKGSYQSGLSKVRSTKK